MSTPPLRPLIVVQHTEGEFLGLMEDHFEGRRIRFNYLRPFTGEVRIPDSVGQSAGLILLGGGPWGSAGGSAGSRDLPTQKEEVVLVGRYLRQGLPVIGIGLGAQILCRAVGGSSEPAPLDFAVGEARRVKEGALNRFLPERYPLVLYMRDFPVLPREAETLAVDWEGRPALFQYGENCFGFTGHPGAKLAMVEDLIMEFDEAPADPAPGLAALRQAQDAVADSLVLIMTGLIQMTGLMASSEVLSGGA
jgi:GMP synthase-like glutamine amidotransferase